MAAGEQFCLKWNDFESNISRAFQDLREDKDFFDITLACDDNQIEAHKVILSACSPFFRKVLTKNPHQHPLIYLRDVKYSQLVSLLDFMYNGEVNVCHEDLNGFLTIAEELKIKGLTQNDGKKSESTDINKERFIPKLKVRELKEVSEQGPPPKRSRTTPSVPVTPRSRELLTEDGIEELPGGVKVEPGPTFANSEIALVEENDNSSADGYSQEGYEYMSYDDGQSQGYEQDAMEHNTTDGSGSIVDGNKGRYFCLKML